MIAYLRKEKVSYREQNYVFRPFEAGGLLLALVNMLHLNQSKINQLVGWELEKICWESMGSLTV